MANKVKVCLKCKHKTPYDSTPPTACEACGAIYRKVEEALMRRKARPEVPGAPPGPPTLRVLAAAPSTASAVHAVPAASAAPAAPAKPAQPAKPAKPAPPARSAAPEAPSGATTVSFQIDTSIADFVVIMRGESLYPAWRELVKWFTWLGYAVALLLLLSGVAAAFSGSPGSGGGLVVGAVIAAVLARVWQDLSLMVADLADAAVRTAFNSEPRR